MKKNELERLAERHQSKADKAFMNYQETGIQRYERERERNEDYADAFRMAAAAADDHSALGGLRAEMVMLATRADGILAEETDQQLEQLRGLAESIIGAAVAYCHYARREKI